ncbi:MAG: hypothetical protein LBH35_05655 [Treponema sp.]|jgi:hypothetical protein|nr:hypothetical protein [Treponema sp.]
MTNTDYERPGYDKVWEMFQETGRPSGCSRRLQARGLVRPAMPLSRPRLKARFFAVLAALIVFSSCSASVSGTLRQDSSGSLSFTAALEPKTAAMIRAFGAFRKKSAGPVLDGQSISRSLGAAPGIVSAAVKNTAPEAIEGTILVSRAGDFLASSDPGKNLLRYEPAQTGGRAGGRLAVHLDRESGPEILRRMSDEAADYLSVLMAPIATGEALGRAEYLELAASVYGEDVAAEIGAARFKAVLTVPAAVKSVKGGSFSGREARFDIPLLEILVLETPLDYEINW